MYPLPRSLRPACAPVTAIAASDVPAVRYSECMDRAPYSDDADAWAGRATAVPEEWFTHFSWLHGVGHAQRVHIHAQRLVHELRLPDDDASVVLSAARWHDIGRVNDGWDPDHGALSVARAVKLRLHARLPEADARLALFAVRYHCRSDEHGERRAIDEDDPERALRILWLLKDADALDRVRLGPPGAGGCEVDSTTLRHPCTPAMIGFAEELLAVMP